MMKTKGKLMKLKNILWAVVLAIAPYGAYAQDKTAPVVIAAGMQGGGYDKFAKTMAQRLGQRGYDSVSVTNNNGSDAITLAACNAKADVWIAQVDAIYTRYQEGCALAPVADYGTEYAVMLVPPKSPISELSDITGNDTIATDGVGSGTELFWKTIVSIENGDNGSKDEWAKAKTMESSPELLNTMANFGDIQAAILVRKLDSEHIKMLLNQGWAMVELWDKDINDEEFNNLPLYESTEATVNFTKGADDNWVYAVRSFVGVSKKHADNRPLKMDVAASVQ
jgi:TRAP-type uncharacterized transport system substrate-binding protein